MTKVGDRYGRWTVLKYVARNANYIKRWKCRCDCGNTALVWQNTLRNGTSYSCGCYLKEVNTKHGHYGRNADPIKATLLPRYKQMIARCYNPKNGAYANYGGRGITVCAAWRNKKTGFDTYVRDIMALPDADLELTIDRIDNDKGYSPKNVRWATLETQAQNKRMHMIMYKGFVGTLKQHAERAGLNPTTVSNRRATLGWSLHRALTTPLHHEGNGR